MLEPLLNLFAEGNGSKLTKIILKTTEYSCCIVLTSFIYKYYFGNFILLDFDIRVLITDFFINGNFVIPLIIFLVVSNFIKLSTFMLIDYITVYLYSKSEIFFKAIANSKYDNIENINNSKEKLNEYYSDGKINEQIEIGFEILKILGIYKFKNGVLIFDNYNTTEIFLKNLDLGYNFNLKYFNVSILLFFIYICKDYSLFNTHPYFAILLYILVIIIFLFFIFLSIYEHFINSYRLLLLDVIKASRLIYKDN